MTREFESALEDNDCEVDVKKVPWRMHETMLVDLVHGVEPAMARRPPPFRGTAYEGRGKVGPGEPTAAGCSHQVVYLNSALRKALPIEPIQKSAQETLTGYTQARSASDGGSMNPVARAPGLYAKGRRRHWAAMLSLDIGGMCDVHA